MAATWYLWSGPVSFAPSTSFLSIVNGGGSGRVVSVRRCYLRNTQIDPVNQGVVVQFDFYKISAHTGGSPVTAITADTTNAALPAQITVKTGASVTNTQVLWPAILSNEEVGVTGADMAGAAILQDVNWIPEGTDVQPLTLREGEGLNVQSAAAPNSSVGSYGVLLVVTVV